MVALGTRVYLSCNTVESLVDGHCLIVPIQHHLNMLEGDDDVWDEVRVSMVLKLTTCYSYHASEFHEVLDAYVCRR